MHKFTRRQAIKLAAASALATGFPAIVRAQAQAWPSRVVRLIVPFAAGGANEAFARNLATKLSEIWGQQVIIENKPGAGGNLGAELVARADPDGHTLLIASFPHAVNRFLYPSVTYDIVADFAPVTVIGVTPNLMVVPNSSPAKTVAEFIAHAKANPGKMTFASSGAGTSIHLSGELFKRVAGLDLTHVPYRGGAPALADLIPGRVDLMFNVMSSVLPQVQGGQMRALAVTTAQRVAAAREYPTMIEAGVPGFAVTGWFGFMLPAKTPPEIVRKVHADSVAAIRDPAVQGRLENLGVIVTGSSPEEFAKFLKDETEKWGPVIKEAGIKVGGGPQ
ncbi:MAG: tripartite tricarboxylate transporter substrate binding protein [Xanthobacteraceae bacterium]|nr:tripartite tricarboxylate transporter substrate binding protein [Xanthobacteraceae bacterium]